ncbi:MAG TPA: hypothetical protein PK509_09615 [Catalimonadaceae bacterium]|nr:hypothetical protein [Catalimonadaceae bacterium]HPI10921.1 hypothetical protein [Catalimonadaceae bacterium]
MKETPENNASNRPVPENFFDEQFHQILKKTVETEHWSIPGTKNVESIFPVPEGYWLKMEEQVRQKVNSPSLPLLIPSFRFKLASATVTFLLLIFAGWWVMTPKLETENWKAQLEKIPQEDLIAFVDYQNRDVQEYTEKLASKSLQEQDLPLTLPKMNETDIEEALEDIQPNDLTDNFDIN